jgi:hypothetical protein
MDLTPEIVSDIVRVANQLATSTLSRSEYVQHGGFSLYQIYDGGVTWEDYCREAGVKTRKKEEVPDEVYFGRLQCAIRELGRHPKTSERKRFGLNFSKRRFPTLPAFIQAAIERGIIPDTEANEPYEQSQLKQESAVAAIPDATETTGTTNRQVPAIPAHTSRAKWERIDMPGFPYAPQDESGTIALFAILCARGVIKWDILDLNTGKGVDCICWDHVMKRELRVELKHRLTRAGWNHAVDDVDYVVCWENRWPDFPKPVISLRDSMELLRRRT